MWANHSLRSLQKSDCERFAQVAYDRRATGAIHSFSQANCYFALLLTKKTSDSFEKLMGEFPTEALKIVTINIKTYLCTLKK